MTVVQPDAEYRVLGPTSHPIHENARVLRFMDALRAANDGDPAALVTAGEQMYAAHESYQENCHLSVDEVDFLVEAVRRRGPARRLYGAKITGGGSGGVVAVFGTEEGIAREVPRLPKSTNGASACCPMCSAARRRARRNSARSATSSARPAGSGRSERSRRSSLFQPSVILVKIRKAVIPAAGLGTRHFPASHAVKKELFPVVAPDGIARALMHYHLLDLLAAGIEEVCLIVQPGDEPLFRAYFEARRPEYFARLAKYPALQAEARQMAGMAARIRYVTSTLRTAMGTRFSRAGNSRAESRCCCRLGDHLFPRWGGKLSRADDRGVRRKTRPVASRRSTGSQRTNSKATARSRAAPGGPPDLIAVTQIIEKPRAWTWRARNCAWTDWAEDEFLGWFGMHS